MGQQLNKAQILVELAGLAQTGPPQAGTRYLSPPATAAFADEAGGAGGTRPGGRLSGRTRYLSPPPTAAFADEAGGAGGTRTRDFCLAKAALSQLSYSPGWLLGESNKRPATSASEPLFAQQIAELSSCSIERTL